MKQETVKENGIMSDRLPYMYIEHAIIEQCDSSVQILQGKERIPVPVASLACLILGPGCSVTHRAIEAMDDSGCLLIWSGEHMRAWYATGMQENRSSANLLKQATYYADSVKHMNVVRWMYQKRFDGEMPVKGRSLEQLRGAEGLRMRDLYQKYAEEYGVEWKGRRYDREDFDSQDTIQQLITVGNKYLYNVCHAVIVGLGYSPAIGFIHTGTMRSFVYDVADLYKHEYVIPLAFKSSAEGSTDFANFRHELRDIIMQKRLISVICSDLAGMFEERIKESDNTSSEGFLWDPADNRKAGINYAHTREL